MRLKNKVAIITGVGTGQGRSASMLFAKEGAKIAGGDWKREDGEITTSTVKSAGGEMVFAQADVSSAKDCENLVRVAMSGFGRIDILYNNAGVGFSSPLSMGDILNTPEEDWDRVLAINLKSMYLMCKFAIPEMIKSGGGSIVNTASIAALIGSEAAPRIHGLQGRDARAVACTGSGVRAEKYSRQYDLSRRHRYADDRADDRSA